MRERNDLHSCMQSSCNILPFIPQSAIESVVMKLKLADVEEEYRKCPDLKREDVQKLLEWNAKQPHLPRITEMEAILFLHSNYNQMEATKTTIDNYFTCRTHVPDFFSSRDVLGDDIQLANEMVAYVPLPEKTPEGYRVTLCRLMNTDPSRFSFTATIKLFVMVADMSSAVEGTAEGHIMIFDTTGVQLGHVARLGLLAMKHFLYYIQEAMPIRLKGIHYINAVPFMDKILAIMKPFMKKELWDILHVHTGFDPVTKFVPAEIFPKDYPGGMAESFETLHGKLFEDLKQLREHFLEEEQTKRVNERLRPDKSKRPDQVFGMDGNFRKLDID